MVNKKYNTMLKTPKTPALEKTLRDWSTHYKHQELYVKLALSDFSQRWAPIVTVDDLKHSLPYQNNAQLLKPQHHNGQRKLFLTEVQFLNQTSVKYCIYAGASPGNKTHYLSELFPNIKFILVDPNRFDIMLQPEMVSHRKKKHDDIIHLTHGYPTQSNVASVDKKDYVDFIKRTDHKIYIIEDYMTDEISELLKELECVFISDIRSNIAPESSVPSDFDIVWNSSMMFNWITILNPVMSMLKFRPLYFNGDYPVVEMGDFETSKKFGIDFVGNLKNKKYIMPKSTLYIQPYAGKTSSELRQWIKQEDLGTFVEYDTKKIDDSLFYFNCIQRGLCFHENKNADKQSHFCHCNDCALENNIWETYANNNNLNHNIILDLVKKLGRVTFRPLAKVHINTIFDLMDSPMFDKIMDNEIKDRKQRLIQNTGKTHIKHKGDAGKVGGGSKIKIKECVSLIYIMLVEAICILLIIVLIWAVYYWYYASEDQKKIKRQYADCETFKLKTLI